MRTPNLSDILEDVTADGLRRLTRYSSLKASGMTRSLPPEMLDPDEDARVLIVRGVYYRKDRAAAFAMDRSIEMTLRADPENEHDPFAVAVDIDGVHVGFLAREVAVTFQPMVVASQCRVAAHWADFSTAVPLIYLVVAWRGA